jgi:hypothetical protein
MRDGANYLWAARRKVSCRKTFNLTRGCFFGFFDK